MEKYNFFVNFEIEIEAENEGVAKKLLLENKPILKIAGCSKDDGCYKIDYKTLNVFSLSDICNKLAKRLRYLYENIVEDIIYEMIPDCAKILKNINRNLDDLDKKIIKEIEVLLKSNA